MEVSSPALPAPTHSPFERTSPALPSLAVIVAFYRYRTTVLINQARRAIGQRFWQRSYWEHVIRTEDDYARIAQYICENPARWEQDRLRPDY